ncbi:hypothetical protein ANANG_G00150340 [Anguilla anguilla]|uniref:Uncharacterized protein n=1 Tax=Anguilla anguilla TaxID=7936 RepID=A0A9D3M9V2_ANGAN|nr:hypothetical protein ANANG_G00150340 [Anguilla anguilla]
MREIRYDSDGRINGSSTEGEKTLSANDPARTLYPVSRNGSRPLRVAAANSRVKKPGKAFGALSAAGSRGSCKCTKSMDSENDKPLGCSPHEGKSSLDKKDSLSLPNGVVSLGAGRVANGYPCEPALDDDGSGSENGYTTPGRRRAGRGGLRGAENVSAPQEEEETMQQGNAAPARPDAGPPSPEPETARPSRPGRQAGAAEAGPEPEPRGRGAAAQKLGGQGRRRPGEKVRGQARQSQARRPGDRERGLVDFVQAPSRFPRGQQQC